MSEYEQAVFISYAWGGEREEVVNQIDQALQTRGIKIIRDKRDLDYKGSISRFMERIGQGDCVIVVVSDKYLRSPNCMFELVEIAENKNFLDRIFPIVLSDADIYKPVKQIQYIKHWENEIRDLKESLKDLDPTHLEGIYEQLNLYDRIRDNISRLTAVLSDMNTLTPDMHQESNFSELYTAVEKRMKAFNELARSTLDDESGTSLYFEPETILIPAGAFHMGSEPKDGIPDYETPLHEVTLTEYRIGKYPVTNSQYHEFVLDGGPVNAEMEWEGRNVPDGFDNKPVIGVKLDDARKYCEWLNEKTHRKYIKYTLPNEAQLEKAYQDGKCVDVVDNLYQWTCTLWGAKGNIPDAKYRYPWQDDGRNNLNANSQVRRVVCFYPKQGVRQRNGQFPWDVGCPGVRHSFRVVMVSD